MVLLILLFFLVCPHSVLATPEIEINSVPSSPINSGSTFPVTFIIKNADIGSSFYYKFFGGTSESNQHIQTSPALPYSSDWSMFSNFMAGVETGSSVINSFAYAAPDTPSGIYHLSVMIALTPKTGDTWAVATSPPATVNIITSCNYNYSDWSLCSSENQQTRTAISPIPTNCFGQPALTQSCTYNPTIVNPDSGISLNEFMPYGSINDKEWVEIYNSNDRPVKLVAWKIMNNNSGAKSFDLSINAKGYGVIEFSSGFLDNNGDQVILADNNSRQIDKWAYSGNNYTLNHSWSLVNHSWCRAEISKGFINNQNCYSVSPVVVSGPTIIPTPTSDPTKYKPDKSDIESAIIEPAGESSFLTPSPFSTAGSESGLVLGDNSSSSPSKKTHLPLILIGLGGFLLASPTIINKIKLKNEKNN